MHQEMHICRYTHNAETLTFKDKSSIRELESVLKLKDMKFILKKDAIYWQLGRGNYSE